MLAGKTKRFCIVQHVCLCVDDGEGELGTCHYLAGGRATILGGRVMIFSLLSRGGTQFFSRIFRGGS